MLFSKQLSLIVGAGLFLIISGNRENIALNKPATQSSTLNWSGYLWQASFATDGNTGVSDSCRCCSGTKINSNPSWLEVDLEREYEIGRIDVYGRNDNMIGQLQGFNLYISNHSRSLTEPIYHDMESGTEQYSKRGGHYTIKVGELRGRYVTVSKAVPNLVICELQVFPACPDGQYEPNCTACNCGGRPCNKSNGSCPECPDGHYGVNCSSCGHCLYGNLTCNKTTGLCHEGCAAGYTGPKCYQECPNGSYGVGCISCGHCLHGNISCDKVTGRCPSGCAAGYTGPTCKQECPAGSFGINCSSCGHCIHGSNSCNKVNGQCPDGCEIGFTGQTCHSVCLNQTFGRNCSGKCHCQNNEQCNHITGMCSNGCEVGYSGLNCSTDAVLLPKIRSHLIVSMSTPVYMGMNASLAIDGSEGVLPDTCHCCSVTTNSASWWRLELGQMYPIRGVKLIGRSDQRNTNSQNGNYTLLLSNTSSPEESIKDAHPVAFNNGYVFYWNMSDILASTITIERANLLIICELKVYEGDCRVGYYNTSCDHECHCVDNKPCNRTSGTCPTPGCKPGWRGPSCNEECLSPHFGPSCLHTCHCINGSHCDHVHGTCDKRHCEAGWKGSSCDSECASPSFGPNCSHTCHCKDGSHCHHVDGMCDQGECDPGWRESSCDTECDTPLFGSVCSHTCHCLKGSHCDHVAGTCDLGMCDPGWKGFSCDRECESPYFGPNCSFTCHCANNSLCDHVSGTCDSGLCETGWQGPSCDQDADLLPMIRHRLTVSMSTPVYLDMNASLAIDGTDGTLPYTCHCCSFTTAGDSWWRLELGQMYPIRGVRLIGRSDSIYQNGHYGLQLSNTSLPTIEFKTPQSVTGKPHVFYWDLSDILASTITIVRSNLLIICGINVYEGDCRVGYYGTSCEHECQCVNNKPCNRTTGTCSTSGCKPGWKGQDCSQEMTQTSMQDDSNIKGLVITVVVLAVTCVVQTGCNIVLWIKLRRTRTNTIDKRTKSCSIPDTSYVNEMVERIAARPNLPEVPEDNLQSVVNVDGVSVDVHSDYQSLYDREITDGVYSQLQ